MKDEEDRSIKGAALGGKVEGGFGRLFRHAGKERATSHKPQSCVLRWERESVFRLLTLSEGVQLSRLLGRRRDA